MGEGRFADMSLDPPLVLCFFGGYRAVVLPSLDLSIGLVAAMAGSSGLGGCTILPNPDSSPRILERSMPWTLDGIVGGVPL
jgi:hypothetical protein